MENLRYFARTLRHRRQRALRAGHRARSASIRRCRGASASIRRACGSGCRWRGRRFTIPRSCCSMSRSPTSIPARRAPWGGWWPRCATAARLSSWSPTRPRIWPGSPTSRCGCRRAASLPGQPRDRRGTTAATRFGGALMIRSPPVTACQPAQGPAPGVAFQGRGERHAVLRPAGGGDLQLRLRSHGGGIAADRRRAGVGGVSVRRHRRPEPGLDARAAQPGAGRLPRLARAGQCAFHGQGAGQFSFCQRCWKRC